MLDIGGLEQLQKLSKNRLITRTGDENKYYIDINISHLFEWSHMLWLPGDDFDVYKEDMWFQTHPLHVPGLPYENPIMTKFMYKVLDFRTVGDRKVAVIEMNGLAEWNMEWNDRTSDELTEFKSWGSMGLAAQYWFDYEKGEIFAITRPGFYDWQYRRNYDGFPQANINTGVFQLTNPGMIVTMEFFYNTNITDVSGKPRLVQVEPEEQRRYIVLNMFCQLEAE